jgi:hypothetical protein
MLQTHQLIAELIKLRQPYDQHQHTQEYQVLSRAIEELSHSTQI